MTDLAKNGDFGKLPRRMYIFGCMCGSILTLYTRKIFYSQETYSYEFCPKTRFDKPWFATLFMALGMSLANIVYKLLLHFSKDPNPAFSSIPISIYIHALLPAALDIIFSVLYSIEILLIGETFATLLRFFDLIFATLLRKFWLKENLLLYSYVSLAVVIVGCFMSSIAITYDDLKKQTYNVNFFIAVSLQILAQLASSVKAIREEQLLHKNDIHPVWLCGVEGVYEIIMILFMAFPVLNFMPQKFGEGLSENFCAAIKMVGHSKILIAEFIIYPFIAMEYNTCVFGVQFTTSAVHFIVLDIVTGSVSWFFDLFIYYVMKRSLFGLTPPVMGLPWTDKSVLRLIGVTLLFIGSAVYTKFVKLPFFKYEESDVKIMNINLDENDSDAAAALRV